MPEFEEPKVIKGHPHMDLESEPTEVLRRRILTPWRRETILRKNKVTILLCAGCESISTIMFLDKDRWICTKCRNEGAEAPTMVPVSRPRGGK